MIAILCKMDGLRQLFDWYWLVVDDDSPDMWCLSVIRGERYAAGRVCDHEEGKV